MHSEPAHPWQDGRLTPDERARLVVAAMTEDEKFSWLSAPIALPIPGYPQIPDGALGSAAYYPGAPRLDIPAIQQADASLGVTNPGNIRPGDNATALPSSLLLGATFDVATARETGALVGRQARAKGFAVQLAGGANLVREATGGRNFEYISEDPLLTGRLAGASVAAIQAQGVVSTVKHFTLNAQETGRVMADSRIEEAAHRESDLLAFQIAIEDGRPGAVMPGYNLVNGHYASENAHLLTDILKGEWGFDGWVMGDWGAAHSTEKAALAGLDVQSGANFDAKPYFGAPLRDAVREGRVPQERIDDMVHRQLRTLFRLGVIDDPPAPGGVVDHGVDDLIAQRAAERGLVLLKNTGDLLPAPQGLQRVVVIGRHADVGVLSGGGSSTVTPHGSVVEPSGVDRVWADRVHHPSSPMRAIRAEAGAAHVDFHDGTDTAAAVVAARGADLVVVIAQEWRAEGLDTQGLGLPDEQEALIEAVAEANPRTVVVVQSGGAITVPWAAKVPAVIAAFYPGGRGAEAIAGVLFGRVNPSGHLPVTFPESIGQLPRPEQRDPATTTSNPNMERIGEIFEVSYDIEGSDVGYRWFEREELTPAYPFGWGLSYTTFAFSGLSVTAHGSDVRVVCTVTNTGARTGSALAQVYVSRGTPFGGDPDNFGSRLAAFEQVHLEPGESRPVELHLEPRLLARWDVDAGAFRIAGGSYQVRIGAHAHDEDGPAQTILLRSDLLS
ncbi:glycoside hydrolase family 3 C-terminal domain-containing protein [Streptomyces phaeochromogenes]|uniref:glycoside hydrolase family 3 C-terminal domain-containing protein n=1 Tax=Streptomyces phaeochromogenes TaxID=1923 RepID=UPI00367E91C2